MQSITIHNNTKLISCKTFLSCKLYHYSIYHKANPKTTDAILYLIELLVPSMLHTVVPLFACLNISQLSILRFYRIKNNYTDNHKRCWLYEQWMNWLTGLSLCLGDDHLWNATWIICEMLPGSKKLIGNRMRSLQYCKSTMW